MGKSSTFELEVLEYVADDYEAPHTIAGDISNALKLTIAEADVRLALLALAHNGLVQAYTYDAERERYSPISASEAQASQDPWFMATPAGRP
ncbi:MAG: hypothetical protein ACRENK_09020 [Gemmatimonadaceae bacterium]